MALQVITVAIVCITNIMTMTEAANTPEICPQDYTYFSHQNKCYKFSGTDYRTWHEAREQCQSEGSDLIVIHDQETNKIVVDYMVENQVDNNRGVWMGLREIDFAPTLQWVDGSSVDYADWGNNNQKIPDPDVIECGLSGNYNGHLRWVVTTCLRLRRYVCEKAVGISVACPVGYEPGHLGKMCYKIQYWGRTFEDSRDSCQQDGGDLVTMADVQTEDYVISLVDPTKTLQSRHWIGLIRRNTQVNFFEWLDGSVLNSTLPTGFSFRDGEFCAILQYYKQKFRYNDKVCSNNDLPSICQTRLSMSYPVFECPQGYKTYITSTNSRVMCLMLKNFDLQTWSNAKDACNRMGGKLFTFENFDEHLLTFITGDWAYGLYDHWGNVDACLMFNPNSEEFEETQCDRSLAYICQHEGIVKIMMNMVKSVSLIGDICQTASDSKISKSENGTIYHYRELLPDENNLNRFIVENHDEKCLMNDQHNKCCVQATLSQPIHLINQTEMEVKIPVDKVPCLCQVTSPIEQDTFNLLRNITNPKNDSTIQNNLCPCRCDSSKIDFNPSPEVLSEMIANIQKKLKVETENLSSKRNKKISAKDNRSESRAMGYLGIALCLVPLGILVAMDISRLFQPKNKVVPKQKCSSESNSDVKCSS